LGFLLCLAGVLRRASKLLRLGMLMLSKEDVHRRKSVWED
jgi:hypothetical protein